MALRWASNLPCKQGRGPKAGRGSGRSGGWRGNTREQDLYYLTTYIYNDKIFIVFYGKLWPCFCSVFGSGNKPMSSKMHKLSLQWLLFSRLRIEGLGVICNLFAGECLNYYLMKFCMLVFQMCACVSVYKTMHTYAKAIKTCHRGLAGSFWPQCWCAHLQHRGLVHVQQSFLYKEHSSQVSLGFFFYF